MSEISIVTNCCNDLDALIKTCKSIDLQLRKPIEHWILNSSSGTQIEDWLNNNPQPIYRKWINKKYHGVYNAIEEGINCSGNNIIHILHAGDYLFHDSILEDIANEFDTDPSLKWLNGKLIHRSINSDVVLGEAFNRRNLYKGIEGVYQQTWFVKKEVYDRVGLYNNKYEYAKEYDLLCRITGEKYKFLNKELVCYYDRGFTTKQYFNYLDENLRIYENHFGKSYKARLWYKYSKHKFKLSSK